MQRTFTLVAILLSAFELVWGQTPANPASDTLVLKDGERLIGHLTRATDTQVIFKSDLAVEVTVKSSDVTELHSSAKLAVIPKAAKGEKMRRRDVVASTPQGTISATGEAITVTQANGQTQSVPVANTERVLDTGTFEKDIARAPGIFDDWSGTATAGLSLVEATQSSRNYTTGISLMRTVPPENWLEKRSRTEIDFTSTYGEVTQPGSPTLKTDIFHASAQQDEYFSGSLYGFGQAMFDHNFSQGLDLQQSYSGGIGWTAISNGISTLDLKAGLSYERQQFANAPELDLIGSTFSENYTHKFHRGWTLAEELDVSPAWNKTRALLANGNITFTMPVYKRLNFTTSVIDSFLNDPAPGFKRNSFQFTSGISYTLK